MRSLWTRPRSGVHDASSSRCSRPRSGSSHRVPGERPCRPVRHGRHESGRRRGAARPLDEGGAHQAARLGAAARRARLVAIAEGAAVVPSPAHRRVGLQRRPPRRDACRGVRARPLHPRPLPRRPDPLALAARRGGVSRRHDQPRPPRQLRPRAVRLARRPADVAAARDRRPPVVAGARGLVLVASRDPPREPAAGAQRAPA